MIFLIYSDLHSNLEALDAFQNHIATIKHDVKVCLGDTVGYGADPNPCIDWVKENSEIILAGNHDFAAVGKTDTAYFNRYARKSCEWTKNELTPANKEFLSSLPIDKEELGIHWSHSSPFQPKRWHYVTSAMDKKQFEHFNESVCFLGHTHIPLILELSPDGVVNEYSVIEMTLKKDYRYIINVGSLGQPRDLNPNPSFVVYDTEQNLIKYHRFSYDISSAQEKIRRQGLPSFLADRLATGN
jgi:diadenosine tetraphosphatase ApaH/serine/threonine PP2A family protein phosphatase